MTIARSGGALLGTDESTGVTITSGATTTGTEVDLLGAASSGVVSLFAVFTPASIPASGSIDVNYQDSRITGQSYQDHNKQYSLSAAGMAASQQRLFLGRFPATRYGKVSVKNGSDVSLSGVSILYELEKVT